MILSNDHILPKHLPFPDLLNVVVKLFGPDKSYVPFFSSTANAFQSLAGGALATLTGYDALGRVVSLQQPGLPAVQNVYTASGPQFLMTQIDAKGYQTQNITDVLGRKTRVLRQSSTCTDPIAPGWCVTQMDYDAAGRLLTVTDPSWNRTTFIYDSLGRKKEMTDPDMGAWDYDYDNNGNLIFQKDARGPNHQPNGPAPGAEDTTYFYDGEPAP